MTKIIIAYINEKKLDVNHSEEHLKYENATTGFLPKRNYIAIQLKLPYFSIGKLNRYPFKGPKLSKLIQHKKHI